LYETHVKKFLRWTVRVILGKRWCAGSLAKPATRDKLSEKNSANLSILRLPERLTSGGHARP